jgi:hypothetical protein
MRRETKSSRPARQLEEENETSSCEGKGESLESRYQRAVNERETSSCAGKAGGAGGGGEEPSESRRRAVREPS